MVLVLLRIISVSKENKSTHIIDLVKTFEELIFGKKLLFTKSLPPPYIFAIAK